MIALNYVQYHYTITNHRDRMVVMVHCSTDQNFCFKDVCMLLCMAYLISKFFYESIGPCLDPA